MLKVDFINVGYGDSTLIRIIEENMTVYSMLVDCGDISVGKAAGKSKRIKAVDYLKKEGLEMIDLLAISHLHLDHTGGILDLAAEVGVRSLWVNYLPPKQYWGRSVESTKEVSPGAQCLLTSMNLYLKALKRFENEGTKIVLYDKNEQQIQIDKLRVNLFMEEELLEKQERIWEETLKGRVSDNQLNELDRFINNASLRMRLCYGGRTVELPGDIYADLWEQKQLSKCDIVKVPHHGHRDSMTKKLAGMLSPKYAVISVSNSRGDCPDPDKVELISAYAEKLLFTDAVSIKGLKPIYRESIEFCIDEDGLIRQIT